MIQYKGQQVRVLSRDSDPNCLVLITFTSNPDWSLFVPASELIEVAA